MRATPMQYVAMKKKSRLFPLKLFANLSMKLVSVLFDLFRLYLTLVTSQRGPLVRALFLCQPQSSNSLFNS